MIINAQELMGFIRNNLLKEIGERNGRGTTLRQELGEVGRLTYLAEADEVDYWHSRRAFNAVENTAEELEERKARFYTLAAKKLLFLNSVCKKTEGTSFVTKRVDLKDLDEVIDLVEGFADTLQILSR